MIPTGARVGKYLPTMYDRKALVVVGRSCRPLVRLIGIVGGFWGIGVGRQRGPHLLAIPQNAPIPKCPKMPQNAPKFPKIPQNTGSMTTEA